MCFFLLLGAMVIIIDLYTNTVPDLIKNEKILVIGNDHIEGVVLIQKRLEQEQ